MLVNLVRLGMVIRLLLLLLMVVMLMLMLRMLMVMIMRPRMRHGRLAGARVMMNVMTIIARLGSDYGRR